MKSEEIKRVSLYLPTIDYETLRRVAYENHVKMNDVVVHLIEGISGQAVMVTREIG